MSLENTSKIPPFYNNINKKQTTITLDKRLGKGGFGTVYKCYDENKQALAVKCIKNKNFGIPCLIEAVIMSTIHHPCLSKALKIHSTPQKLYIIQELALSDLRSYNHHHYDNINNNNNIYVKWIHMIIQGVSCLHRYGIIHGDIKANNILVYSNMTVKLSDFTLSTHESWDNNYKLCTPTHRPLEVWLGEKWGKPIDIWALGCTVYEIVYKKNLFMGHGSDKSINAILDWNNCIPKIYKSDININYRDPVIDNVYKINNIFDPSIPINKLILSCLIVDHTRRPTIKDIMDNDIFELYPVIPSIIITSPASILSSRTKSGVRKFISKITNNKKVIELAYNVYCKAIGLINANDKIKLTACTWIAHKLITRDHIPLDRLSFDLHEILQMERKICDYLSYRLYCKIEQVIIKENT
jgi:serine/threonine protein kinase